MNQSGAAIGNCANNSVCHLEPAAAGNVTFSSTPFPVVLAPNSPTGFQVDLNVANLLSAALGVDCLFVTAGIHAEEFGHRDDPDPAAIEDMFSAAGHAPKAVTRRLVW